MIEGKDGTIEEIYSENFESHSRGLPEHLRHGRDAMRRNYAFLRSAFSDMELVSDQETVEGDTIGLHWTWTARHTGDFLGIPPTGIQVTIEGFDMLKVRDGRIREAWIIQDNAHLMAQLQAAVQAGSTPA